jgi:hypothetical protein
MGINYGDVISFGDPYQWERQGIRTALGSRISRITAAAVIDNIGSNDFALHIYPSTNINVASDYPKRLLTIPTNGTVISASLRLPSSPNTGDMSIWGRNISSGCSILSSTTDALSLCWKTASGASLASNVKLSAVSGVLAKGGAIRFNATAATPNVLGAANTVDGVVSLKNVVAAGNALSSNLVRLSLDEKALLIVDLAVSFTDDAIQYDDVPGISRKDIFL